MAKFFGKVGYEIPTKTAPGIYEAIETIREYYGDEDKRGVNRRSGDSINDNVSITNVLSIVADPFAFQNFQYITWVEWMGVKWHVQNVTIERPRLTLSLGEVYNANTES